MQKPGLGLARGPVQARAARGVLDVQRAGGDLDRGEYVQKVLVVPTADQRPVALDTRRAARGRHHRIARLILAQQHQFAGQRFFKAASSSRAAGCFMGSPRNKRSVERQGRMSWQEQKRCMADLPTRMPLDRGRWSASAAFARLARSSPSWTGPPLTHCCSSGVESAVSLGGAPGACRSCKPSWGVFDEPQSNLRGY